MDKSFLKKITESLKRYLSLFGSWLKEKCHRYQLIRWFIVACLSIFLATSIYLIYVAKTANVKGLENALERPTTIYDKDGDGQDICILKKGHGFLLTRFRQMLPMRFCQLKIAIFTMNTAFPSRGWYARYCSI